MYTQREFRLWEPPYSKSFFQIWRRIWFFWNCQKNGANTGVPFFLRNYGGPKKYRFSFLTVFDKNTGHRVTKICPEYLISNTYKSYFINFFVTRIFFKKINFIYAILSSLTKEEQDGVVGRVVVCETAIPGSRPSAANFFCVLYSKSSAFAEGGSFFGQKKLRILLIIYYINCRYDRRFTEDLRPPHFWQMNSNEGLWGSLFWVVGAKLNYVFCRGKKDFISRWVLVRYIVQFEFLLHTDVST